MTTQPSDSAQSTNSSNKHVLERSIIQQPPNSLGFQVSPVLIRHEDRVKLGHFGCLSDCMEFIVKSRVIQNQCCSEMRRILGGISKTMNDDQLPWLLDGYGELFEVNLNIIQFYDDSAIDDNEILQFLNDSDNGVQSRYPNFVIIMHQTRKNLFAPLYVAATDGSLQTSFPINDKGIIEDIYRFFQERNSKKSKNLPSKMCNIGNNNQCMENANNSENICIYITACEKNIMMPASEAVGHNLQLIHQLIKNSGIPLDHISIPINSILPALNAFDQLSNNDTIKIVADKFHSILELLQVAKSPSRGEHFSTKSFKILSFCISTVEEVEASSSIGIYSNQNSSGKSKKIELFAYRIYIILLASNNTKNTKSSKRIRTDQSPSSEAQSSTNSKRLATSENNQKSSTLILDYDPPEILREPARYQHVRMSSDLKKRQLQIIQGGGQDARQRTHVMVKVPPNDDCKELYLRVRPVTVNNDIHLFKSVVPQKLPTGKSSTSNGDGGSCLLLDKNYVNQKDKCTYLLINSDERDAEKKEILAHLITLKQQGTEEEDLFKKENIHNICKLEFCFCTPLDSDKYESVSNVAYSTVIEDGDGPVKIDSDISLEKKLCERGGQIINFGLNVKCLKKGRIAKLVIQPNFTVHFCRLFYFMQ
ncbi:unnamed protein product [Rotaria sp. Silwood2]|nr:unnamed protein product [Rotaria sp. Silwood2]CAF4347094.1 unnamed protein product [Rotaria sp. Silwood2]